MSQIDTVRQCQPSFMVINQLKAWLMSDFSVSIFMTFAKKDMVCVPRTLLGHNAGFNYGFYYGPQ